MEITVDWLRKEEACDEAVRWATPLLGEGKPLDECIKKMKRADWLLWLLWRSKAVNTRQLVKLACVAGRISLRHVPASEDRPRLAYEAAEAWVADPTRAAWAAGAAARAAAWAAGDAGDAGDAAGAAARAAWGAGDAAGAAARAAGDADEHRKMCDTILSELEKPEFKALKWPI